MKVMKQGEMYTVELHENDLNTIIDLFKMLNITTCSQVTDLVEQIRGSRREEEKLYLIAENGTQFKQVSGSI